MLSRARKYKLGLILAHQHTGQIPSDLLKEILGNVSTAVCFGISREDALRFSREFITECDGEILNVPEEEILRRKVGQAGARWDSTPSRCRPTWLTSVRTPGGFNR
jgi:hypothetical protein